MKLSKHALRADPLQGRVCQDESTRSSADYSLLVLQGGLYLLSLRFINRAGASRKQRYVSDRPRL